MLVENIFCLAQIEKEKQTKQTKRVNHNHLLLQERDTKTTGTGKLIKVVAASLKCSGPGKRARCKLLTRCPALRQPLRAESGSELQKISLGRFSVVDVVRLGALKQNKLNLSLHA